MPFLQDPLFWLGLVLGAVCAIAMVMAGLGIALLESVWLQLGLFVPLAGLAAVDLHCVLHSTPSFAATFLIGAAGGSAGAVCLYARLP